MLTGLTFGDRPHRGREGVVGDGPAEAVALPGAIVQVKDRQEAQDTVNRRGVRHSLLNLSRGGEQQFHLLHNLPEQEAISTAEANGWTASVDSVSPRSKAKRHGGSGRSAMGRRSLSRP